CGARAPGRGGLYGSSGAAARAGAERPAQPRGDRRTPLLFRGRSRPHAASGTRARRLRAGGSGGSGRSATVRVAGRGGARAFAGCQDGARLAKAERALDGAGSRTVSRPRVIVVAKKS